MATSKPLKVGLCWRWYVVGKFSIIATQLPNAIIRARTVPSFPESLSSAFWLLSPARRTNEVERC